MINTKAAAPPTCGRLKAMVPGTTLSSVLMVKTNLCVGVVFTVTWLQKTENASQNHCNFTWGMSTIDKVLLVKDKRMVPKFDTEGIW